MSISAFEGAAGCGKTYSVIEYIREEVASKPLLPHQKLLALTFMHGARHRLDEHLKTIEALASKYEAITLDSFVWQLCHRWRARVKETGGKIPEPGQFDAFCSLAASLLAQPDIRAWVACAYPFILVDEAQDLQAQRLAILTELAKVCSVGIAFDEFQCLDGDNRPVAVTEWIPGICTPTTLTGNRRTQVTDLITAAHQIRSGQAITISGSCFQIKAAPSNKTTGPVLAATLVGYQIRRGGSFALLTPSRTARYGLQIVDIVSTKQVGKQRIGPFPLRWEGGDTANEDAVRSCLANQDRFTYEEATGLLNSSPKHPATILTVSSLKRAYDASGIKEFSSGDIINIFNRQMDIAKHLQRRPARLMAMTIHQAKNREFDHIVVLWPYEVGGDPDSKRRLLYNAVTRARKSCLVLVQNTKFLSAAPFA